MDAADTGRTAASGIRVVSLVPSVTETLVAWGVQPVACTEFCERPELTTVGGTKTPDVDAIVRLGPDVVVMDEEENRVEDRDALVAAGVDVVALAVRDIDDVVPALVELAARVGVAPEVATGAGADAVPDDAHAASGTTAFVPIWPRPWMGLGTPTYGSSVLARMGVANVLTCRGPYPAVDLDDVRCLAPRVVIVPSEPYRFRARHLEALRRIAPVVEVDGQDLFWWGIRTPAALRRLAGTIVAQVGSGRRGDDR